MWECQIDKMVKNSKSWKDFVRLTFTTKTDSFGKLSEQIILSLVNLGEIFVVVEVDSFVPDHLYSKFAYMSLIFCNTELKYEAIGEHMQGYLSFTKEST